MKKETFPPQVYKRPWGGIPVIYSFGDIFQLAPVGMTSISQLNEKGSSKKVGKSGHLGKLAFKRFLDPDDVKLWLTAADLPVSVDDVLAACMEIGLALDAEISWEQ